MTHRALQDLVTRPLTSAPTFLPFVAQLKPCGSLMLLIHPRLAWFQGPYTACPFCLGSTLAAYQMFPSWLAFLGPPYLKLHLSNSISLPPLPFIPCLIEMLSKMFYQYSFLICVVYCLSSLRGCKFPMGRSVCLSLFCLVHCCTSSIWSSDSHWRRCHYQSGFSIFLL